MSGKKQIPTAQPDLFADQVGESFAKSLITKPLTCKACAETYLTVHDVADRYRINRASVWRWVQGNARFPRPLKLSRGTSRWRLSDLVAFERTLDQDGVEAEVSKKGVGEASS